MFSPELIDQFWYLIDSAESIGICVHTDPDGDCLGSGIGLGLFLKNQGKRIRYFAPTSLPRLLLFVPEADLFATHIPSDYHPDLWISVDTANRERSNLREISTHTPIVHIDHHITQFPRGTHNMINENISSTCEIITYLLKEHAPEQITPQIATTLLMGISTDTGHFQRGKEMSMSFSLASFLIQQGADLSGLVNKLYRANTYKDLLAVGLLLQDIVQEDGLIRVSLDQSKLNEQQLDEGNVELLLHLMTSIAHDGIFLLIKQFPHAEHLYLKCSFRTKNPHIDVRQLASELGGGGHRAAAACRILDDDLGAAQEHVLAIARQFLQEQA